MPIKLCKYGHKMTKANTYSYKRDTRTTVECKTCRKLAQRRYHKQLRKNLKRYA